MAEDNPSVVRRAIAAVNARDIDAYLARCTGDVELRTPAVGGTYVGPEAIKRFFGDIEDTAPDFHLDVEWLQAVGDNRVVAFLHVTGSGRVSGLPIDNRTANVYELVDGRLSRIEIYDDRQEALDAVGLQQSD
jgi:ketosteroid isomerase-like protein